MQIWEQHQRGASIPSALHRLQLGHERHQLPPHHPLPRGSGCRLGLVPATGTSGSPGPDSAAEWLHGGNMALLIAALLLVLLALRLRRRHFYLSVHEAPGAEFSYPCSFLQPSTSGLRGHVCAVATDVWHRNVTQRGRLAMIAGAAGLVQSPLVPGEQIEMLCDSDTRLVTSLLSEVVPLLCQGLS